VGIRPRLNVRCNRCGKVREGLRHVCRSNSARRATIRLAPVLGTCSRCGKEYGGRNGNPLTHTCRPKTDFRKRKAAAGRKARASARAAARAAARDRQRAKIAAVRERERQRSRARAARLKASYELRLAAAKARAKSPVRPKGTRPRRPPHEYQSCADKDCQRPVCLAFKEGYRDGYRDGFEAGYAQGFSAGFAVGLASCPGPHGG
jgi:hypothetical protein